MPKLKLDTYDILCSAKTNLDHSIVTIVSMTQVHLGHFLPAWVNFDPNIDK